jgi:DNA-binding transcriptional MocR family regulator
LGWLVGPQEVIDRLSFAKRTSDLATNSMVQVILTEFLQMGLYQEHSKLKSIALYGQASRRNIVGSQLKEFKVAA